MSPLLEAMIKLGVVGNWGPKHTPPNPPQESKVQPVGTIEEPYQVHGKQNPSDLTGQNAGNPATKTPPARETNMWGDGDKLPAIPGGVVGGKVGPRPSQKAQEAMQKGFLKEFHGLKNKK